MIDEIRHLVEVGWAVHLLKPRSKAPVGNDWSKLPVKTWNQLEMAYREGQNVGVRLGKWSEMDGMYLHALDLDIKDPTRKAEAWKAVRNLFPTVKFDRFPTVQSGSGGESRHIYFLTEKPFDSHKLAFSEDFFVDEKGTKHRFWEIELFGTGKQVALPPSIHPDTGKPYRWIIEPDLDFMSEISEHEVQEAIDVAMDERSGPEGDQDTSRLELTYRQAEDLVNRLAPEWCEDRDLWVRVGMALSHEFDGSREAYKVWEDWSKNSRKYKQDVCKQQWRSFKDEKNKVVTMRSVQKGAQDSDLRHDLEHWDDEDLPEEKGAPETEEKSLADEFDDDEDIAEKRKKPKPEKVMADPNMGLIAESSAIAPPFPKHLFGKGLAAEFTAQSIASGAPEDFIIGAFLAACATCIGNTNWVKMKEGFTQPMSLWVMIVGSPSSNKSPGMRTVIGSIRELEARMEPHYRAAKQRWDQAKQKADIHRKAYEKLLGQMAQKGEDTSHMEVPDAALCPPEPPRPTLMVNDATIEAFIRQQEIAPRGFLTFRDEVSGWLGSMSRYKDAGTASDRAQWLESYDGGSLKLLRIKDGDEARTVHRIYSPVLGGIQPDKLQEIMSADGGDDGFQARWMTFWPESPVIPMSDKGRPSAYFTNLLDKLLELRMDEDAYGNQQPFFRPLTKEAQALFIQWANETALAEKHVVGRLSSAFGKARGHMLRMAGLFEFIWWADKEAQNEFGDSDELPVPQEITLAAMKAAIEYRESYMLPMQKRVYQHSNITVEMRAARALASWIVNRKKDEFSIRDVKLDASIPEINRYSKTETIEETLSVLVGFRWVERVQKRPGKQGGRPREVFRVNPRVWELLE